MVFAVSTKHMVFLPCLVTQSAVLGSVNDGDVKFKDLAQAPYNAIRRMRPLEAYATMSSSVSGKRWDRNIADGLHNTLNTLAAQTAVWHTDCLPDKEAAIMTSSTI